MKPKNIKKYIEYLFNNIDCRVEKYPFGIVVAGSFQDACSSAEMNWKWKRISHNGYKGWESTCGRIYRYVGTVAGLYGYEHGTPLICGYGYSIKKDILEYINAALQYNPPLLQLASYDGTVGGDKDDR